MSMDEGLNEVSISPAAPADMSVELTRRELTSGRLLARNTGWNLAGQLLPMFVGAIAVPPLVRGLGMERFGVLSLAWVVIGYFSLFDMGIGRALTKVVADKLGHGKDHEIPTLVWTSLALMLLLGVVGAATTYAISPWLVTRVLKIARPLQHETLTAFYLLAVSIPVITVTSGLRGVLEAQQRFRLLTFIRVPLNIFTFVGPLMVLPFSRSLVSMVLVLTVGRLVGAAAHFFGCLHALPGLRHSVEVNSSVAGSVVRLGSWMTVTNIVGPMMVYMDRFLVGSLLSVGAIAYYTAPFDMVTRLLVIPAGLAGVLFPALALSLAQRSERTAMMLSRSEKYVFVFIFPVILAVVALAPEGLRLWLGEPFAQNGATALRWLAVGVFANSVAQMPYILIQSAGRPDLTAKLHLSELPVYLIAVWFLTKKFGISGTAIAWAGRNAVDALVMFILAHRLLPRSSSFFIRFGAAMTGALLVLYMITIPGSFLMRGAFLGMALLAFALATWFLVLEPGERGFLFGA